MTVLGFGMGLLVVSGITAGDHMQGIHGKSQGFGC